MTRIIIAHQAGNQRCLQEALNNHTYSMSSISIVNTQNELMERLRSETFDRIFLDTFFSSNCAQIFEKLKTLDSKRMPKKIITSTLAHDGSLVHKSIILSTNTEFSNVDSILSVNNPKITSKPLDKSITISIEGQISNTLNEIGIPVHLKGYVFIREGISLVYENNELLRGATKKLYPSIARKFLTTSSRVERAMRHAIDKASQRANPNFISLLCKHLGADEKIKPTNLAAIATIAEYLRIVNINNKY